MIYYYCLTQKSRERNFFFSETNRISGDGIHNVWEWKCVKWDNDQLTIAEEKIIKLEDMAKKYQKWNTKGKKFVKNKKVSASYAMSLSGDCNPYCREGGRKISKAITAERIPNLMKTELTYPRSSMNINTRNMKNKV